MPEIPVSLQQSFACGRYLLEEQLGSGSMGLVFKARDRLTERVVALKKMQGPVGDPRTPDDALDSLLSTSVARPNPKLNELTNEPDTAVYANADDTRDQLDYDSQFSNPEALERSQRDERVRFAQEFQTLASFCHDHVVRVLDFGFVEARQPYFTMEYLPDAQDLVSASQGRSLKTRLTWLDQVLQALIYMHRRGVLHRDLKPSNVLVSEDRAVVLDFGVSLCFHEQADQVRSIVGTLPYMAPELLNKHAHSPSSDLYAFGLLIYQVLTGEFPFRLKDLTSLTRDIHNHSPDCQRPDIPKGLQPLLTRLLDKDPENRPQSSTEAYASWRQFARSSRLFQSKAASTGRWLSLQRGLTQNDLESVPFVGRQAELEDLLKRHESTTQGPSRAVLISAESGQGKSRLIRELELQVMVRGDLVLRTGAQGPHTSPFQLWQRPLEHLCLAVHNCTLNEFLTREPFHNAAKPDDAFRLWRDPNQAERLLKTTCDFLHSIDQPVTLIVEDIHHASRDDIIFLSSVFEQCRDCALFILASLRSDERPALAKDLPSFEILRLDRFHRKQVSKLTQAVFGERGKNRDLQKFLLRQSHGNIFIIIETLRALGPLLDSVSSDFQWPEGHWPESLEGLIKRRIETLSESSRHVLQVAALCADPLDADLLQQFCPEPVFRWFAHCRELSILVTRDGQWSFAHERLREAILTTMPEALKVELHRVLARTLQFHFHDKGSSYAAMATHWLRAGDPERALEASLKAGRYAFQTGAYNQAIEFLTKVLDDPRPDRLDSLRAERLVAESHYHLGQLSAARQRLQRCILRTQQQGVMQGHTVSGLIHESWQKMTPFLNHPEQLSKPEALELVRIYLRLGHIDLFENRSVAAMFDSLFASRLAWIHNASDEFAECLSHLFFSFSCLGWTQLSKVCFEQAKRTFETIQSSDSRVWLDHLQSFVLAGQGQLTEAFERLDSVREHWAQSGDFRRWYEALSGLGWLCQRQGQHQLAKQYRAELLGHWALKSLPRALARGQIAMAETDLHLGANDRALRRLRQLQPSQLNQLPAVDQLCFHGLKARLELRQRQFKRAQGHLEKALNLAQRWRPTDIHPAEAIVGLFVTASALTRLGLVPEDLVHNAQVVFRAYARRFPVMSQSLVFWQARHQGSSKDTLWRSWNDCAAAGFGLDQYHCEAELGFVCTESKATWQRMAQDHWPRAGLEAFDRERQLWTQKRP